MEKRRSTVTDPPASPVPLPTQSEPSISPSPAPDDASSSMPASPSLLPTDKVSVPIQPAPEEEDADSHAASLPLQAAPTELSAPLPSTPDRQSFATATSLSPSPSPSASPSPSPASVLPPPAQSPSPSPSPSPSQLAPAVMSAKPKESTTAAAKGKPAAPKVLAAKTVSKTSSKAVPKAVPKAAANKAAPTPSLPTSKSTAKSSVKPATANSTPKAVSKPTLKAAAMESATPSKPPADFLDVFFPNSPAGADEKGAQAPPSDRPSTVPSAAVPPAKPKSAALAAKPKVPVSVAAKTAVRKAAPKAVPKTTGASSAKSAAKPAAKLVAKPAAKSAAKPAVKSAAIPPAPVTKAPKPAAPKSAVKPAAEPVTKSAAKPTAKLEPAKGVAVKKQEQAVTVAKVKEAVKKPSLAATAKAVAKSKPPAKTKSEVPTPAKVKSRVAVRVSISKASSSPAKRISVKQLIQKLNAEKTSSPVKKKNTEVVPTVSKEQFNKARSLVKGVLERNRPQTEQERRTELLALKAKLEAKGVKVTRPAWVPTLIQIKGKRHIRAARVPATVDSLNEGDAFVLDGEFTVYIWLGKHANKLERAKAVEIAARVNQQSHKGLAEVVTLVSTDMSRPDFWEVLGARKEEGLVLRSAEDGGDDEEFEEKNLCVNLWRVGRYAQNCVAEKVDIDGRLKISILDPNRTLILDCLNEVYVWKGKRAPELERKFALSFAQDLLKGRPEWVKVQSENDGTESVLFKEKFFDWFEGLPVHPSIVPVIGLETVTAKPADVREMYTPPAPPPADKRLTVMETAPKGDIQVWRALKDDKVALPPSRHGVFYSGESYLVLYSYRLKNKNEHIVFFWQGRDSSITEKGSSAVQTIDMSKELESAPQVRVVQFHECREFLQLFSHLIVMRGNSDQPLSPVCLYAVQQSPYQDLQFFRVAQCDTASHALNSRSVFLLVSSACIFLWIGKGAREEDKEAAKRICASLPGARAESGELKDLKEVQEGSEDEAFWTLLGGKKRYDTLLLPEGIRPQLFHCSNSSGHFNCEPVWGWSQDSLEPNDMMLLDTGGTVFVWDGPGANHDERRQTYETVMEYVERYPVASRPRSVPVLCVRAGEEPVEFTAHFFAWNSVKSKVPPSEVSLESLRTVQSLLHDYTREYTIEELRKKPPHLDQNNLEKYLSDADFQAVFGCTRKDFYWLNQEWRRIELKKQVGLY